LLEEVEGMKLELVADQCFSVQKRNKHEERHPSKEVYFCMICGLAGRLMLATFPSA
jgi:hypothetical protein